MERVSGKLSLEPETPRVLSRQRDIEVSQTVFQMDDLRGAQMHSGNASEHEQFVGQHGLTGASLIEVRAD